MRTGTQNLLSPPSSREQTKLECGPIVSVHRPHRALVPKNRTKAPAPSELLGRGTSEGKSQSLPRGLQSSGYGAVVGSSHHLALAAWSEGVVGRYRENPQVSENSCGRSVAPNWQRHDINDTNAERCPARESRHRAATYDGHPSGKDGQTEDDVGEVV